MDTAEKLKRSEVLLFDDGTLTVRTSGWGEQNGWAELSFHERQFKIDADGFYTVEIPPSEIEEIRQFLNRLPKPVDTATTIANGDCR